MKTLKQLLANVLITLFYEFIGINIVIILVTILLIVLYLFISPKPNIVLITISTITVIIASLGLRYIARKIYFEIKKIIE